jgi:hypothetical protein
MADIITALHIGAQVPGTDGGLQDGTGRSGRVHLDDLALEERHRERLSPGTSRTSPGNEPKSRCCPRSACPAAP